jgi:hypothetical protein
MLLPVHGLTNIEIVTLLMNLQVVMLILFARSSGVSHSIVANHASRWTASFLADGNDSIGSKSLSAAEPQPNRRERKWPQKAQKAQKDRTWIGSFPYVLFEPFVAK